MFYTNVNATKTKILLRARGDDGQQIFDQIPFKPSLFVRSNAKTEFQSLDGYYLKEVHFDGVRELNEWAQKRQEENTPYYGNHDERIQWISQNYPDEVPFDLSKVKIATIDIETTTENGFPDPDNPTESVILISLQDFTTKKVTTFGTKPFQSSDKKVTYIQCDSEKDLLKKFIEYFSIDFPDVLTGWNCEFFDIPYLVNRIKALFSDKFADRLSPWGVVRDKTLMRYGKEQKSYYISGVAVLDYYYLYRKFTYVTRESYKLDYIAKVELGKEKLKSEYKTFKEFYTKDWDRFVEYNIRDVNLVDELEDKMKLIELVLTMAYDAKCNYDDIYSPVKTWDCIIFNHLLKKNTIVPAMIKKDNDYTIEGGYVKEPTPGIYEWIVSFDATSLYPSIIMHYNLSPEKLIEDRRIEFDMKDLLSESVDLSALKEENLCMGASGYLYSRDSQGMFPEIVQRLFDERQKYKKMMLQAKKEYEQTNDTKYLKDISKYNNYQMARKIQLNSLFGAMANKHFRYFDNRIAESITLSGQYIIQNVIRELNIYLNSVCGTTNFDFAFYGDTDSCYVTLKPLVDKFFKDKPKEKIVDMLDKICDEKITEAINKSCNKLSNYTNSFDNKIFFKRESIADRGVFIAKKRYAMNVFDSEGIRFKEPDLKVMGLEIVKSSTPEKVREMLKESITIVLRGDEKSLQEYVRQCEDDFMKMSVEDISFPRSVNGLDKYSCANNLFIKGTPIHVKASLLYNHLLTKCEVESQYPRIQEGDKIKFCYLKEPNRLRQNSIGFVVDFPSEFDLDSDIDYDLMFEKAFLEPLKTIIECAGWKLKSTASLEGLFV